MQKTLNRLNFIILMPLIAACAILPDMGDPQPLKDISAYQTQKSFTAPARAWPSSNWWIAYGDTQLNALMDAALQNAPRIAEAQARMHQAEAITGQVEASLYPNIKADGYFEKIRQSYNQGVPPEAIPHGFNNLTNAQLELGYQIDFWGRNRDLLAAATSEAEAAKLEAEQTRLIVSTSLAGAYADLAQLYADLDAANQALDVRDKTASLIKKRQDNGLENRGSYEQELALKSGAEAEIAALDEAIALAKNRIAALMGAGPDRALTIERPQIENLKPFGLPENLPAELLGRRPDIIAARLQAGADLNRIDAAEASFYPNVNLVGYIGHQSLGLSYFTSPYSLIAGVGPAVTLPILDGGELRSQYRTARATYDATAANYNATLLQALHEVANAVTSEKMLAPRTQKTTAALRASEEAYDVVNNRYKGGLSSYLAVLRAEDSLIANRRALADINARAFTLDVALIRALGGGFASNEQF